MRVEITSERSPGEILAATRAFFLGPNGYETAWLETESRTHLGFGTFRGNLAVAAFPDPEGERSTRVRISTLREEGIVPRLVTHLRTLDAVRSPAAPARAPAEEDEAGAPGGGTG